MSFAKITASRAAVDRIRRFVSSGRVPPSLLFAGPDGSGKLQAATNLAKALNCLRADEAAGDACDECSACRRIDEGSFPDVRRVGREGPGGQVKAESVRQVVAESPFRPFEGKKRVYIFEEADRMNPTAANTLLKTLEEPPPWTVLVLLTANESAILPTLLSRCQKIRFLPLLPQEVAEVLIKEHQLPRETARLAAGVAGGNLTRALELADDVKELYRDALEVVLLPAKGANTTELVNRAGQIAKHPRLPILLRLTACLLRDTACLAGGGSALQAGGSDTLEKTAGDVPLVTWLDAYLQVEETIHDLEVRYLNKRIRLEQMLFKLGRTESTRRRHLS
jgi:DNA polymerase-3 subunit delta'